MGLGLGGCGVRLGWFRGGWGGFACVWGVFGLVWGGVRMGLGRVWVGLGWVLDLLRGLDALGHPETT